MQGKPIAMFNKIKKRSKQLTRRSGGSQHGGSHRVAETLSVGLAQTPRVWPIAGRMAAAPAPGDSTHAVEEGSTIYRELIDLGASEQVAKRVAGNSRCWWWRNSDGDIKRVLTIAYFDRLGVSRLS